MITRPIVALCMFLAAAPVAVPSVRVERIPESLERPRITVLLKGAPVSGAKIEIERQYQYPRHNKTRRSHLVTDDKGQIRLPKLPYGLYRIVASTEPNLTADKYLNFSPGEAGKEGIFSMELQSVPSRAQMLLADEQLPITTMSAFHGVVRDQAGAPIPNVPIEIVQMDAPSKPHTTRIHANRDGNFSAKLKNGDYIVFFAGSGFSTRIMHLAISGTEISSDLKVILQIAPST